MRWRNGREITSKQIFTWLMVLSVVLLLLPRGLTDRLDHAFMLLLGPLSGSSRDLALQISGDSQEALPSGDLSGNYSRLRKMYDQAFCELTNVRQELEKLQDQHVRWSGLRQEFGLARARLIVGQVLGQDSASWSKQIYVNRGSLDHVQQGQIVLGAVKGVDEADEGKEGEGAGESGADQQKPNSQLYQKSVVGRVKQVGLKSCTVQLLVDEGFSWPTFVEPRWDRREQWHQDRADGVLKGGSLGELQVTMISTEYPVQVGDAVVACSDPGYLPVAMLVGRVKHCQRDRDNPVLWQILVEPAVDLNTLSEVVIVDAIGM
ncbi:MAG: rod shape-determining protein MreC [Sedimentisphaerales bacterium]|nr:rod shape-determining protein MreC [Sedimentisphaerales bacterium]